MYIEPRIRYYRGTQQCIKRGLFLILIEPKEWENKEYKFKALVRKVALQQFGHFMMGIARIYGQSVTVSGSYGGDGLPCRVSQEIYDRARVELPDRLYKLWANGGGWNSAGSEAEEMRKWALENLPALRK